MDKQTKIYLVKVTISGSPYSPNGGPRWTAQIDGKFLPWKYKIIEREELLCLREAVLELQNQHGSDVDIFVREYIDPQVGYKNIPVEFYIEHFDMDGAWFRKELLEHQEQKIKAEKTLKQKLSTTKDFGFLMLDDE